MIPPPLTAAIAATIPASPPLVQGAGHGSVDIGARRFVNLASCDYLGMARFNHASLIDGIRTIRPQVSRLGTYGHHAEGIDRLSDELEQHSEGAARVIVTDGVFSIEGDQAPLRRLVDLAAEFGALLIVDDSHGTGVLGEVDVIASPLGKALSGAGGGFVAGAASFTAAARAPSPPSTSWNPRPVRSTRRGNGSRSALVLTRSSSTRCPASTRSCR